MPKLGMEEIRKAALINAALEVLVAKGLDGTTLALIADQAGCSKGVAAYYFGSKDVLFRQAFEAFFSHYQIKCRHHMQGLPTVSAMVLYLVDSGFPPENQGDLGKNEPIRVDLLDGPQALHVPPYKEAILQNLFFALTVQEPSYNEIVRASWTKDVEGIGELLRYGIVRGEFQDPDPEGTAFGLESLFFGLGMMRGAGVLYKGGLESRQVLIDYLKGRISGIKL